MGGGDSGRSGRGLDIVRDGSAGTCFEGVSLEDRDRLMLRRTPISTALKVLAGYFPTLEAEIEDIG